MFVLDGDPNLGKSTVLLDLAVRVSSHGVMPDGQPGQSGAVIIMSAEDEICDTIIPRLLAANANLDNIVFYEGVRKGKIEVPATIPGSLWQIEQLAKKRDVRLVVVDPLMAYIEADSNNDQSVRKALRPVKEMAGRCRLTVAYLRHLNKGSATKAIYRGGGSIAIIGAARAGALIASHPDDDDTGRKVLAHTKWNLSTRQASLTYTLEMVPEVEACRVNWLPERCELTADDLLQSPKGAEAKEEAAGAIDRATEWLKEILSGGGKRATELYEMARAAKPPISETTLRCGKTVSRSGESAGGGRTVRPVVLVPPEHRNTGTAVKKGRKNTAVPVSRCARKAMPTQNRGKQRENVRRYERLKKGEQRNMRGQNRQKAAKTAVEEQREREQEKP